MSLNLDSKKAKRSKNSAARLLVVEDEHNVGSTLVDRLRNEKYEVAWARNLEEAALELAHRRYDLILLDIGLPDGSGFSLAQKIREEHSTAAVVFLSAMGTPQNRIKGLELGAEDFIVKPFHWRELLLRIQVSLKRAHYFTGLSGQPGDEIKLGKSQVHFSEFKIISGKESRTLTHKECALLKLLVERQGKAVSREEILREIWSEGEVPSTRTIDNFILRLRKMIEVDPENPQIILSIRGVGYQLSTGPQGENHD